MRTTIDIPDKLDPLLRRIARDRGTSLSQVVGELLERAIGQPPTGFQPEIKRSALGLPVITCGGRMFTSEDVRSLDDIT